MTILDNPNVTALVISIGVAVFKGIKELIASRIHANDRLKQLLDEIFEAAAQYTYDSFIRDWVKANPGKKLDRTMIEECQKRTYAMADQIAQSQGISIRALGHPRLVNRRIERAVRTLKRRATRGVIAP